MKTTVIKFLLFILIVFINLCGSVYAQKEGNIWPMGSSYSKPYAINFNIMDSNGYPTIITPEEWPARIIGKDSIVLPYNAFKTGISNKDGNFLFGAGQMYSLVLKKHIPGFYALFDSNRTMIENSDYLYRTRFSPKIDGQYFFHMNDGTLQPYGHLIIPIPGKKDLYYFFHIKNSYAYFIKKPVNWEEYRNYLRKSKGVIYYSIVDMSHDNAKVIQKNQFLDSIYTNVLTAMPHANGRDVWLITHSIFKDSILAYKVSPYGISPPVVSNLEGTYEYFYQTFNNPSNLGDYTSWERYFFIKSSANNDKLITRADRGKILLLDFDNANGKASLITELNSEFDSVVPYRGQNKILTAEFSPCGNMLYTTEWSYDYDVNINSHTTNLYQYEINLNYANHINNSKTLIKSLINYQHTYHFRSAPDNKVYLRHSYDGPYKISAIHQPSNKGEACDIRTIPWINYRFFLHFPNIPPYLWFQRAVQIDAKQEYKVLCAGDSVNLSYTGGTTSPPPTNTLNWYIFNPDSDLVYQKTTISNHSFDFKAKEAGKYEILIINELNDSIRQSFYVTPIPEPVLPEVIHSEFPDFYLDAGPADNYLWSTGQEEQIIHISKTGLYTVTKDVNGCSITESVAVLDDLIHLHVPNAFSPEGYNPVFKAYGEDIISFNMTIYNRWGQKLFETKDINKGWDGKINNLIQPAGAYVYKISFISKYQIETKTLNGIFYLIK